MVVPRELPPLPHGEMPWAQLPIAAAPSPCLSPSNLRTLCPPPSEPPVTMVRVPRDLGVPETGVASFECELSRPSAEVKWFKVRVRPNCLQQCPAASSSPFHPPSCCRPCWGCRQRNGGQSSGVLPACSPERALPGQDGQELRPGPNCRIYSTGRRRVLQLSRCELADAGIYTCDAGDCRASATLHVQGTATQLPGAHAHPNPVPPAPPRPWPPWHPAPRPQSARSASCRTCRMPRCGKVTTPSSPVRHRTGT